jgi:hypothetical protein
VTAEKGVVEVGTGSVGAFVEGRDWREEKREKERSGGGIGCAGAAVGGGRDLAKERTASNEFKLRGDFC